MATYTLTICSNNETLQGSRNIDEGLLDAACDEATAWAFELMDDWELDVDRGAIALPRDKDGELLFDVAIAANGHFKDWHGGRMDGDQYFRYPGAQKHGFVVIKCDDVHAEIPPELVTLAEAIHSKMDEQLDKFEMEAQYDTFGHLLVDWVEEAKEAGIDPVLVTILLLDKGIDLSCHVIGNTKTEESLSRLFAEISTRYPKPENN